MGGICVSRSAAKLAERDLLFRLRAATMKEYVQQVFGGWNAAWQRRFFEQRFQPAGVEILVVDGQEILNYGRQSIPTYVPGHRLNSGVFGCMGVGLPFGIGAKVARPNTQVVVLHGDGSYGINGMEIDTAVRHNIPVLVVISLNGGWTADPKQDKPGRNLGYTRYDKVAQDFGAYGEYVEKPAEIRPALERAVASGKPAVVNVKTDYRARAQTIRFSAYST